MRYPEFFLWNNPVDGQPMWMAMAGMVGLEFEALANLATAYNTLSEPGVLVADLHPGEKHPAEEDWDTMQAALLGYLNDRAIIELEREVDRLLPGGASV